MYSVYQHWDPLKTCVVGRTYPPEFYDWIKDSKVRTLFEKIALETEEDLDNIEKTLQGFGVKTLRPKLPAKTFLDGSYVPPPMTPRDYMVMVGEDFWHCMDNWENFYHSVWQQGWPAPWKSRALMIYQLIYRKNAINKAGIKFQMI